MEEYTCVEEGTKLLTGDPVPCQPDNDPQLLVENKIKQEPEQVEKIIIKGKIDLTKATDEIKKSTTTLKRLTEEGLLSNAARKINHWQKKKLFVISDDKTVAPTYNYELEEIHQIGEIIDKYILEKKTQKDSSNYKRFMQLKDLEPKNKISVAVDAPILGATPTVNHSKVALVNAPNGDLGPGSPFNPVPAQPVVQPPPFKPPTPGSVQPKVNTVLTNFTYLDTKYHVRFNWLYIFAVFCLVQQIYYHFHDFWTNMPTDADLNCFNQTIDMFGYVNITGETYCFPHWLSHSEKFHIILYRVTGLSIFTFFPFLMGVICFFVTALMAYLKLNKWFVVSWSLFTVFWLSIFLTFYLLYYPWIAYVKAVHFLQWLQGEFVHMVETALRLQRAPEPYQFNWTLQNLYVLYNAYWIWLPTRSFELPYYFYFSLCSLAYSMVIYAMTRLGYSDSVTVWVKLDDRSDRTIRLDVDIFKRLFSPILLIPEQVEFEDINTFTHLHEDLRADAMSLQALKHAASYKEVRYTRKVPTLLGFTLGFEIETRSFIVSLELAAQLLNQSSYKKNDTYEQVKSNLDRMAGGLHTINIDRGLVLQGHNVDIDTKDLVLALVCRHIYATRGRDGLSLF